MSGSTSPTTAAIEKAKAEGRAALVGYLPAGFPDVDGSIEAMTLMVEMGCDIIEIGLPYSDPVMDGPTIQAAAQVALEGGVRTADVFRTVEAVAAALHAAICCGLVTMRMISALHAFRSFGGNNLPVLPSCTCSGMPPICEPSTGSPAKRA